jgi:hypothetical protein
MKSLSNIGKDDDYGDGDNYDGGGGSDLCVGPFN